MTINTKFNIGDKIRPADETTFINWGVGVVEEIDIKVTGTHFRLSYYVKVKPHGGYRLCMKEEQMILVKRTLP